MFINKVHVKADTVESSEKSRNVTGTELQVPAAVDVNEKFEAH